MREEETRADNINWKDEEDVRNGKKESNKSERGGKEPKRGEGAGDGHLHSAIARKILSPSNRWERKISISLTFIQSVEEKVEPKPSHQKASEFSQLSQGKVRGKHQLMERIRKCEHIQMILGMKFPQVKHRLNQILAYIPFDREFPLKIIRYSATKLNLCLRNQHRAILWLQEEAAFAPLWN